MWRKGLWNKLKKYSIPKDKIKTMSSGKYVTNEYKALLNNTAVILSIVLFAIIGINAVLAMIAPSWTIRLFVLVGLIMSMGTARLLYVVIKHFY